MRIKILADVGNGITLPINYNYQLSIESTLTILAEHFRDADITMVKPILEAIEDLDRLKQLNLTASIAESFLVFRDRKASLLPPYRSCP